MPREPIRILLQTTIPPIEDDWNISRFSLLANHLASLKDESGRLVFRVTTRDRKAPPGADDAVLSALDTSDFDELWLFAVDTGDGLTEAECAAIGRFRSRGGGLLVTRDHEDLGGSVCALGGVGAAHYFHTHHLDPDESRRCRDDPDTVEIAWPNYHSGANGDYQEIVAVPPIHPLLRDPRAPGGILRFLPAHPHEGGVGAPPGDRSARVIATGRSKATARGFNLIVAFERSKGVDGSRHGRAVAQSTFHHFCDYNWDPRVACPSFVDEPAGNGMIRNPDARRAVETYSRNLAEWLGDRTP